MKFLCLLTASVVPLFLMAQSSTQNYIVTTIPFMAVSDPANLNDANSNSTIQYFDGLGRLSQTVKSKITPSGADLITALEYDVFGRLSKTWLPAVVQGNNGAFYSAYATQAVISNSNDTKPFTTTEYEESPLNRIVSVSGPGNEWYVNSKKVITSYVLNGSNSVKYFYVDNKLKCNGYYTAATLYGVQTTDEDGKVSVEFTDKTGRVILTRTATNHDTYYVYDDLGNLCYVLPPLAADKLSTNTAGFPETPGSVLYKYAYIYHYDGRKRCIEKKLPGAEWISYVYDRADRLILSQDGNQKINKKWKINKYDKFGRLLYSGILNSSNSRSQMETSYSGTLTNESYSPGSSSTGYTTTNLQHSFLLAVNYYDNYDFRDLPTYSEIKNALTNSTQNGYTAVDLLHVKTLLTGKCIFHLDDSLKYELTAAYYDKYGRPVQVRSCNHMNGFDKTFNLLDFTGKTTAVMNTHDIDGTPGMQTEIYNYTFDKAQRLLATTHKLNNGITVTLSSNSYDQLGRLAVKSLGCVNGVITYSYNVRGWVTGIVSNKFSEVLYYNTNNISLPDFTACYNGNISGMKWDIPDEELEYERAYSFAYDGLDRLTYARYCGKINSATASGTSGKYNEQLTYDKMGNINSLFRHDDGVYRNKMTYTYTGNQLKNIDDVYQPDIRYGSEFFKDMAKLETEYLYDNNGNNTYDANSGISTIKYNLLNLPDTIQFMAGHQNMYSYNAEGRKLTAESYTLNNIIVVPQGIISPLPANAADYIKVTVDYTGNMIYQNGTLKQILTPEGFIKEGDYYYYLKDHLGNVRVVLNNNGNIIEKSHYYPTGIRYYAESTSSTITLPFRYNSKEFMTINGLNRYDYGARMYDPAIGRWHTTDPLAESYSSLSPYHFSGNNPLRFLDLTGMDYGDFYNKKSKWLGSDGKTDDIVYTADNVTKDEKGIVTSAENSQKLSITHTEFQKQAAAVYGESSIGYGITSKEEMFAIGSTHQRNKIAYGVDNANAKSFLGTSLGERSGGMAIANASIINALTGGPDYSNGADQWDGAEQAMVSDVNKDLASNGTYMYKMNVMGWSITDDHYKSWKTAIEDKFGSGKFTAPQNKAALHDYGGMKNTGLTRLNSTAQYGLTIFWKTTK